MTDKNKLSIRRLLRCLPGLPVEGGIVQQELDADVLLQEAVSQDGHRGEADVVHRQIGRVIQGLGRTAGRQGGSRTGAEGGGAVG